MHRLAVDTRVGGRVVGCVSATALPGTIGGPASGKDRMMKNLTTTMGLEPAA
jgi:hypothetical protein